MTTDGSSFTMMRHALDKRTRRNTCDRKASVFHAVQRKLFDQIDVVQAVARSPFFKEGASGNCLYNVNLVKQLPLNSMENRGLAIASIPSCSLVKRMPHHCEG